MNHLSLAQAAMLFEEAKAASENTYSPYSQFAVGAAVLTADGLVFRGTNVESGSYGVTICAERVAVANAISAGKHDIRAIAVYANTDSVARYNAVIDVPGVYFIKLTAGYSSVTRKVVRL